MKHRIGWTYLLTLVVLVGLVFWALSTGADQQPLAHTWQTLLRHHRGAYWHTIVAIRLPRIVAALVAGAALAVAGAFFQATTRTAIADPSILGVSAAADLFVLLAGVLAPQLAFLPLVAAWVGGLICVGLLLWGARRGNPYQLLLIGVALNAMFVGLKALFVQPGTFSSAQSLATITWAQTLTMTVVGVLGLMAAVVLAPWANALKIGDAQLATAGLSVGRLKVSLLGVAVLLCSTVTAYAGVLPFIGILVPHLARRLVGHDYRELVPFTTLLGAATLLLIDTLGRTLVLPNEIAAATILAIIGGPALIVILVKKGVYHAD